MVVRRVVNSVFNSCSYVIVHGGRSWIVDCGDVDQILPCVEGNVEGVLLTHAHFDHIFGLNNLLSIFPSIPVVTNQAGQNALLNEKLNFSKYHEEPFVLESTDNIKLVNDGDVVQLDENLEAKAVFTPGHSPDCVTWVVEDTLFTGDSFIPGVKTVTNFPLSDKALAARSENLIRELAAQRTVYPGHAIIEERN